MDYDVEDFQEMPDIYSLLPENCSANSVLDVLNELLNKSLIAEPNFTGCYPQCGLCSTTMSLDADYLSFNLILSGVVLPMLGILGLMGNSISAFIYSRPECRNTTNLYLCALGCSDSAVIITAIFLFGIEAYRKFSSDIYTVFGSVSPVVYPMGHVAQVCSVYFTLAAGADCFAQICLSHRIRAWVTRKRTVRNVVLFVVIFSIAYNIPHCFESVVVECYHSKFHKLSFEVCPAVMRFHPLYEKVYYKVMYAVFVAMGPLICLIVMNVSIVITTALSTGDTGTSKGDTIALILVVLLFIMCNTVALILNSFESYIAETLKDYFNHLVDLSNLLVVFNSSFNFVIYVSFSDSFRRTLKMYVLGRREPALRDLAVTAATSLLPSNGTNGHSHSPGSTIVISEKARLSNGIASPIQEVLI